jgi:hypothetical protein
MGEWTNQSKLAAHGSECLNDTLFDFTDVVRRIRYTFRFLGSLKMEDKWLDRWCCYVLLKRRIWEFWLKVEWCVHSN